MRQFLLFILMMAAPLVAGCTDYQPGLDNLQKQIDELTTDCNKANSNAESLQKMIEAISSNESAVSYTAVKEGGSVVGFKINFSESGEVTVYNSTCALSVIKQDGRYWWAENGEPLMIDGRKVEISKESAAPQFKVEGNTLKMSLDGGATWADAASLPQESVTGITDSQYAITVTLADGSSIVIEKADVFGLEFAAPDMIITKDSPSVSVPYRVTGSIETPEVQVIAPDGWLAKAQHTSDFEGVITVTATDPCNSSPVCATLSDGHGKVIVEAIPLTVDIESFTNPQEPVQSAKMPILAWAGLAAHASQQGYKDMAAAGFTLNMPHALYSTDQVALFNEEMTEVTGFDTVEDRFQKIMDAATGTGIKQVIYAPVGSSDEAILRFINKWKDHPAFGGYQTRDEPEPGDTETFLKMAHFKELAYANDPDHFCFFNMRECYTHEESWYENHINELLTIVKPDFYAFDSYPCLINDKVDAHWYKSLEVNSRLSKQNGISFWGFANACQFDNNVVKSDTKAYPNVANIRLQQYSNLAYGAQGLCYFMFELLIGNNFGGTVTPGHTSAIQPDGSYTDIYDAISTVNNEIQNLAHIFLGCNVTSVRHTSDRRFQPPVPYSTTKFMEEDYPAELDDYTVEVKKPVLISQFTNGGHRYMMVVNKSFSETDDVSFTFNKDIWQVNKDGSVSTVAKGVFQKTMDPGDALIFRLD